MGWTESYQPQFKHSLLSASNPFFLLTGGIISVNHLIVEEKGKKIVSFLAAIHHLLYASVHFLLKELGGSDNFLNLPLPESERKKACESQFSLPKSKEFDKIVYVIRTALSGVRSYPSFSLLLFCTL